MNGSLSHPQLHHLGIELHDQNMDAQLDWYNTIQNDPNLTCVDFERDEKFGLAVSALDCTDKYSVAYMRCVGLLGITRDTQENTPSFLSHQSTNTVNVRLSLNSLLLLSKISELQERSHDQLVDIIAFGGNISKKENPSEYIEAIQTLDVIVQSAGLESPVVVSPKLSRSMTAVHLLTSQKKLHIRQPFLEGIPPLFIAKDVVRFVEECALFAKAY